MPIQAHKVLLGFLCVAVPAAVVTIYLRHAAARRLKDANKGKSLGSGNAGAAGSGAGAGAAAPSGPRRVLILYGTCTGTAKKLAYRLDRHITRRHGPGALTTSVINVAEYNEDQLDGEDVVLFLCSTWTDGAAPESAQRFVAHLKDYAYDFRVSKDHLEKLQFAVFGLGAGIYGVNFAKAACDVHAYLEQLGACALLPACRGDSESNLEAAFEAWCAQLVPVLPRGHGGDGNGCGEAQGRGRSGSASTVGTLSSYASRLSQWAAGSSVASQDHHHHHQQQQQHMKNKPPSGFKPPVALAKPRNGHRATQTARANAFQRQQLDIRREAQATREQTARAIDAAMAGAAGEVEDEEDEVEEEDRINDGFVTMDLHRGGKAAGGDGSKCRSDTSLASLLPHSSVATPGDAQAPSSSSSSSSKAAGTGGSSSSDEEEEEEEEEEDDDGEEEAAAGAEGEGVVDVEDMGPGMAQSPHSDGVRREMVTKLQRKALTKEGYRIIGSHSAVKLCRWTKNQMRGRGGCYKHTFYGITSYQVSPSSCYLYLFLSVPLDNI